ncbi:MAG: hypothetical protein L6R42_000345 [Xanthoria sp. 1 TBL-2021]|nr:MAG: hypothetical protein L6R42_000345 [Xanthoria sp. 1 TBL-2021]
MTTPTVTVLSHTFTQPDPPPDTAKSITLGIPDNATAGYSPPQAIWFYDTPKDQDIFSTKALTKSLQRVLSSYPAYAGRLEHIPYRPDGDWSERFGRLRVNYGTDSDPGVETVIAHCEAPLASLIPNAEQRGRVWNASDVPFELFSGQDIKIALHDGLEMGGLPAAIVKMTTFACGGIAIAARLQHVLGDAQAFLQFVRDWAATHRAMARGLPLPVLTPIFNPRILDERGAGDINGAKPEKGIIDAAQKLPVHRYDWWASGPDCPEPFQHRTKPSPELQDTGSSPLGLPLPWKDWDTTQPTPHYVLHYTAEDISKMYHSLAPTDTEYSFSRLDALLAHLWASIVRSRNIPPSDPIFLNFAFNFRTRMTPPLPSSLLGVPACMIHATSSASSAHNHETRSLAIAIRKAIKSMNGETIPLFLHEVAHQVDTQRYWQLFGGRHHVMVTSWLQHGMCEVDFGAGMRPRFVEALMPGWIMQLMESRYGDYIDEDGELVVDDACSKMVNGNGHGGDLGTKAASTSGKKERPWYSSGVDISFNLEADVLEKLLQEPLY